MEPISRSSRFSNSAAGTRFKGLEKKLSLIDAVVTALQGEPAGTALNTRELVALAVEKGLWQPSGAKTPEQTLYSAIFRENATKENPRIVKSDKKGKFIYAGK